MKKCGAPTKERRDLAVPYSSKDKVKEEFAIKFDKDKKTWYYEYEEGNFPEGLKKYMEKFIDIAYEDREVYKARFKSMKWDRDEKSWKCSAEDFEQYEKYGLRQPGEKEKNDELLTV